jgi:hypothetical protein
VTKNYSVSSASRNRDLLYERRISFLTLQDSMVGNVLIITAVVDRGEPTLATVTYIYRYSHDRGHKWSGNKISDKYFASMKVSIFRVLITRSTACLGSSAINLFISSSLPTVRLWATTSDGARCLRRSARPCQEGLEDTQEQLGRRFSRSIRSRRRSMRQPASGR